MQKTKQKEEVRNPELSRATLVVCTFFFCSIFCVVSAIHSVCTEALCEKDTDQKPEPGQGRVQPFAILRPDPSSDMKVSMVISSTEAQLFSKDDTREAIPR